MGIEKETIIQRVKDAGIVGCGGAGFPTHVKISSSVDTVIANGAECEPLIKTDQFLMKEKAGEIIRGLKYVLLTTEAEKGVLALKAKYHEEISSLKKQILPGIEIFELEDFYPAGDEHVLVNEITGRVIPEGGIPLDVGVVVDNVATLRNIALAVEKNQPVVRRFVTITGEVEKPVILNCAIGTEISQVLKIAQPLYENFVLISGGPMMGEIVSPQDVITKTTNAIIVLSEDSPVIWRKKMQNTVSQRRAKSICDQCMDCTITCPRNLLGHRLKPHEIMRMNFFESGEFNEKTSSVFLCSQCGLCEIACPQGLSPRKVIKAIRDEFIKKGFKNILLNKNPQVHSEKNLRKFSQGRVKNRLGIYRLDRQAQIVEKDVVPEKVKIPLKQHVGAPSIPVVQPGAEVKEGDLIAKIPQNALGANVHASISGTVVKVDEEFIYIEA